LFNLAGPNKEKSEVWTFVQAKFSRNIFPIEDCAVLDLLLNPVAFFIFKKPPEEIKNAIE